MKIEMVNPNRLNPSAWNPRRMTRQEMEKLRRSIRDYGMVQNIVVQMPGNHIIGGHQRVEAAIAEGLDRVPVVRLRISDAKADRMNLALNKISGEWDLEKLRAQLEKIQLDPDSLETGYERDEIEKIVSHALEDANIERVELRPAPEIVWYLMGIPLNRFAKVQKHVAALEATAEISVQSSQDKEKR